MQPLYELPVASRTARNVAISSGLLQDDDNAKGFRRFLLPPRGNPRRTRRRQQPQQPQHGILSDKTQGTTPEPVTTTSTSSADGTTEPETTSSTPPLDSDARIAASSSSESSSDSEDDAFVDGYSDSKETFVLEIDDETDEDLMSVLLEQELPEVSATNSRRT